MSAFIDETLQTAASAGATVVLFSKSYCPYCMRAKAALAKIGIAPVVVELDERSDGISIQQALLARTGQRTVPSAWLDGTHIGGSDDVVAGVKSGKFDHVTKGAVKELVEEAGLKHCGAGDGLPCLCYEK